MALHFAGDYFYCFYSRFDSVDSASDFSDLELRSEKHCLEFCSPSVEVGALCTVPVSSSDPTRLARAHFHRHESQRRFPVDPSTLREAFARLRREEINHMCFQCSCSSVTTEPTTMTS